MATNVSEQEKSFHNSNMLLDDDVISTLSSLSCSSIPEPEFDPLSLTPPSSPQLINSGDYSMPSPLGSPGPEFDFADRYPPSQWLEDLKSLEQGHVQKLVDSWEAATQIPEPPELKKVDSGSRRSIVQPMIEYWESKEKEMVLVSCAGCAGHTQCTGSSLDKESKIHCSDPFAHNHYIHNNPKNSISFIEEENFFKLEEELTISTHEQQSTILFLPQEQPTQPSSLQKNYLIH